MNGLAELKPIDKDFAGYLSGLLQDFPGLQIRFSGDLARPVPKKPAVLRRVMAVTYEALAINDPLSADTMFALQYRVKDENGWCISIANTEPKDWARGSFKLEKGKVSPETIFRLTKLLHIMEDDWAGAPQSALAVAAHDREYRK